MESEEFFQLAQEKMTAHFQSGGTVKFKNYGRFKLGEDQKLELVNKCGCALTITAVGNPLSKSIVVNRFLERGCSSTIAMDVLGLSWQQELSLVTGFDGEDVIDQDLNDPWYLVGVRLRGWVRQIRNMS